MSAMSDNETYNGYANRETWAFNLHWQNDQGLYGSVLGWAEDYLTQTYGEDWRQLPADEARAAEYGVGDHAVTMLRDYLDDMAQDGEGAYVSTIMGDIGSWWRIDYAEVGEAVRESLEAEGE